MPRAKLRTSGYMTSDEVAVYLKIDPETVRKFVREGALPASKLRGRWLRFTIEAVSDFERREMKPAM